MTQVVPDTYKSMKIAFFAALGNWIGDALLFPIDTISTRLKAYKYEGMGPLKFAKITLIKQKLNLFRGVELTSFTTFIPSIIYLTIYDSWMNKVSFYIHEHSNKDSFKLIFPLFISGVAQSVTLLTYLPIDLIRIRIQMKYQYSSIISALGDIWKKQGILRCYKSSKLYLVSRTFFIAFQFQSFQMIRYFAGPSYIWMMLNTLISTAIAVSLVNPLEVLITRYALVDTTKQKLILFHMANTIRKRQGIRGFYKGFPTQLVCHCLYALFWLPLYQIFRQRFGMPDSH